MRARASSRAVAARYFGNGHTSRQPTTRRERARLARVQRVAQVSARVLHRRQLRLVAVDHRCPALSCPVLDDPPGGRERGVDVGTERRPVRAVPGKIAVPIERTPGPRGARLAQRALGSLATGRASARRRVPPPPRSAAAAARLVVDVAAAAAAAAAVGWRQPAAFATSHEQRFATACCRHVGRGASCSSSSSWGSTSEQARGGRVP